jgi:hypothetical protein
MWRKNTLFLTIINNSLDNIIVVWHLQSCLTSHEAWDNKIVWIMYDVVMKTYLKDNLHRLKMRRNETNTHRCVSNNYQMSLH